ncbi:hypothetical protein B4N89_27420 [Embleya scabrispora]|uniref:HTH luxR-type domain-containing protein n=1 Tax=Embleya scabrispora TaxID=159449 RepID=A0A1T3P8E0_9ACTN|nr:hypothetical protein B4N89_27420 [Embleya scabrispora]
MVAPVSARTAEEVRAFASAVGSGKPDEGLDWCPECRGWRVDSLAGASRPEVRPQELQVLRGIARGLTNGQIGRELFITEETVKGYLKHLYKALGVKTRAAAVGVGFRAGLLTLDDEAIRPMGSKREAGQASVDGRTRRDS